MEFVPINPYVLLVYFNGFNGIFKMLYSPRRLQGVGLTDGEGIERFWSYLRKFSKMTKEMTSANREDMLTFAILHHCNKLRKQLGKLVLLVVVY